MKKLYFAQSFLSAVQAASFFSPPRCGSEGLQVFIDALAWKVMVCGAGRRTGASKLVHVCLFLTSVRVTKVPPGSTDADITPFEPPPASAHSDLLASRL